MRLTDEQVLEDYAKEMEIDLPSPGNPWRDFMLSIVKIAREKEPRINSGAHLCDWVTICDDDDDFASYYGEDYFD